MPPSGKLSVYQSDENHPAEREAFEKLLFSKYDYTFKRGNIVSGTVITVENSGVVVDVGAKTAAYVPAKEFGTGPGYGLSGVKAGDQFEFFILREEDEDGQLTLSRKRVFTAQSWKKLEDLVAEEAVVDCQVTSVVKGGLLVEVMGLRGFIPSSHLRVRQSLDEMVGQTLQCKILSVDQQRSNIILSHRKVMSEQMAEQRRELFSNIQVGSVVEGEVVRLTDFGAFIDIGGVDGLLPLSQMSWRWVEHPSDVLKIGDKVKVEVIGIDQEKQRVSLSIKSQHADPWSEVSGHLGYGQEVQGTITRLKHFGAFVEVYPGVEALLPSRDVTEFENQNQSKLESGMKIQTFISKFNPEERRISLSLHPVAGGGGGSDYAPHAEYAG